MTTISDEEIVALIEAVKCAIATFAVLSTCTDQEREVAQPQLIRQFLDQVINDPKLRVYVDETCNEIRAGIDQLEAAGR